MSLLLGLLGCSMMCCGIGGHSYDCGEPPPVPPGQSPITRAFPAATDGTVTLTDDGLVTIEYTDDRGRRVRARYVRAD